MSRTSGGEGLRKQRIKVVKGSRLVWYWQPPDESYWFRYWETQLSAQYYQKAAQEFEYTETGRILLAELDPSGCHLDAGCGLGFYVAGLLSKGYDVKGIDYSMPLVERIREVAPYLPLCWGDVFSLNFPDAAFDSYISLGVIEHYQEGFAPILSEARRVLKPGGKLILSVPFFGPVRKMKAKMSFYAVQSTAGEFYQYAYGEQEFLELVHSEGFEICCSHKIDLHRMLFEEVGFYRFLTSRKGGRFIRKLCEVCFQGKDGHMLMVVGKKAGNNQKSD